MVQIEQAEGDARNQCIPGSLDHHQVKLLSQSLLCRFLPEHNAIAQKVGHLLPHIEAEKGGRDLVVGSIHIPVCPPLQIVNDLLIAIDGGVFPFEV